jgi:hypothetical protein
MARFSELEDGLTTSATRTDARAQATGVSHSSVIEATFLLDRVRPRSAIRLAANRGRSVLRRGVRRRVASWRDPKSAPRASRPNRVEVPCLRVEAPSSPRTAHLPVARTAARGGGPSANRTYAPEAKPLAEPRFSGLRITTSREGRREESKTEVRSTVAQRGVCEDCSPHRPRAAPVHAMRAPSTKKNERHLCDQEHEAPFAPTPIAQRDAPSDGVRLDRSARGTAGSLSLPLRPRSARPQRPRRFL